MNASFSKLWPRFKILSSTWVSPDAMAGNSSELECTDELTSLLPAHDEDFHATHYTISTITAAYARISVSQTSIPVNPITCSDSSAVQTERMSTFLRYYLHDHELLTLAPAP